MYLILCYYIVVVSSIELGIRSLTIYLIDYTVCTGNCWNSILIL